MTTSKSKKEKAAEAEKAKTAAADEAKANKEAKAEAKAEKADEAKADKAEKAPTTMAEKAKADKADKADEDGEAEVIASPATDQVVTSYPEGATPSEQFPERRATDVDVADVKAKEYKGEHLPPLNAESFVVLDGSHKGVPKELDGKIAAVIDYPTTVEQDPDTGETISYLPPKASITVRTLDQGQVLYLPMEAFKQVSTNGRAGLLGFA